MIQIAIVEDEEIYVKQLTEYIRKYQTERGKSIKVTIFGDGEDITENYSGSFDIILMDIQMRFMDGMTAAEKIRQIDQKVIIMFITNMIQYAVRGYEVDAMDYVVKPVEYFSFSQKLDKAIGRMRSEVKEFLTIPIGKGVVKIDIADIYFIEGQKHNVIYYTSRGDYSSRITMKELEEKLTPHNFFRCAKGYLVNMNHVEGFVGSDCVINNVHIPVSRAKKKEFMNLLLQNLNVLSFFHFKRLLNRVGVACKIRIVYFCLHLMLLHPFSVHINFNRGIFQRQALVLLHHPVARLHLNLNIPRNACLTAAACPCKCAVKVSAKERIYRTRYARFA